MISKLRYVEVAEITSGERITCGHEKSGFFWKQQEGNPGKIMSNGGRAHWQYETRKVDWGQIAAIS